MRGPLTVRPLTGRIRPYESAWFGGPVKHIEEIADMPLFTYRCTKCDRICEILVRAAETPICPSCGSDELEKQASAFAAKVGSAGDSEPACPSCAQTGACPFN